MNAIIFAGVGFIAPPMVEGFLSRFAPASLTTSTMGKFAIRIASVIGLTFAVGKVFGRKEANMVAIGGSVYIASQAIATFAPGMIPGLGQYVIPGNGLGSYVESTGRTYNTMGAMPTAAMFPGNGGGYNSGAIGGTAARFKRY